MRAFSRRPFNCALAAICAALFLPFGPTAARAQSIRENSAVGKTSPAGWTLECGHGRRESAGPGPGGSLSVTGTGDDVSFWRRPAAGLKPLQVYRIRFQARVARGFAADTVVGGFNICSQNFSVADRWQPYSFVFKTPTDLSDVYMRFGQRHLKGVVFFADISVTPVLSLPRTAGHLKLGAGESIDKGVYVFDAMLESKRSNAVGPLTGYTAPFDSNRWMLSDGKEVVYRHELAGVPQTSGSISLALVNYVGGECVVLASADGKPDVEAGRISGSGEHTLSLPASLYPAKSVQVRLRCEGRDAPAGDPAAFTVTQYRYTGSLANASGIPQQAEGSCRYMDVTASDPRLRVNVENLGCAAETGNHLCRLTLLPSAGLKGAATVSLRFRSADTGRTKTYSAPVTLRPGKPADVAVPFLLWGTRAVNVEIDVDQGAGASKRRLFAAQGQDFVPAYLAEDYGYPLASIPEGRLWWCESTYKVHPLRQPPVGGAGAVPSSLRTGGMGDGVKLFAARRERQAVQLVLWARPGAGPIDVSASDLLGRDGAVIPGSAVQIRQVAYVPVRIPTDSVGLVGDWPDPLPPLSGAWTPCAGMNNPLWITVTVPENAAAGDYRGSIVLQGAGRTEIPLSLHVWNFALPARTSLRSAFSIDMNSTNHYQHLVTDAQKQQVWDMYMQDFAAHRMSPQTALDSTPIRVDVVHGPVPQLKLDFTDFDRAAHRCFDELGFNAIGIGFPGLGGGRYPKYEPGSFQGYAEGTPEYESLLREYGSRLQSHLAERGWLDKIYVYWYDEPAPLDYPIVNRGTDKLRRFAPRLKNMLTEGIRRELYGNVDIWCVKTSKFYPEPAAARQRAGEEIWWYICTGPREPYATLFIDHPAVDLRIWMWQTWKYHVQGILIWDTNYWDQGHKDPWVDGMSYMGDIGYYGNGDGRFFYPPNRDRLDQTGPPDLSPPVDTVRLEILAEGISDWEYFHLLDQLARAGEAQGVSPALVAKAKGLLVIPDSISRDLTHFTLDPQPLYRYRAELARTIEAFERAGVAGER